VRLGMARRLRSIFIQVSSLEECITASARNSRPEAHHIDMLLKNWTMRVSGICEEAEDDTDVEGNVGWRMHLKTPVFARGF
jgi:hypothetical protein